MIELTGNKSNLIDAAVRRYFERNQEDAVELVEDLQGMMRVLATSAEDTSPDSSAWSDRFLDQYWRWRRDFVRKDRRRALDHQIYFSPQLVYDEVKGIFSSSPSSGYGMIPYIASAGPISSLDSNILYLVSAMVKVLCREIKNGSSDVSQLFVLTHNVYFHKEASFIDGKAKEDKDVNYWIVRKNDGISKVQFYGPKNPISSSIMLPGIETRQAGSIRIEWRI